MEFKLKPPFNLIFMGLGILFFGIPFPLASYALSQSVNFDSSGSFSGVISSQDINFNVSTTDIVFPLTEIGVFSSPTFSSTNVYGSIEVHIVTTEGDFVIASCSRISSGSFVSYNSTGEYVGGFPVSFYTYADVHVLNGKTIPSSVSLSYYYPSVNVVENNNLIDFFSNNSFYYGSYTPLNFMYDTSLSSFYNFRVLKGGNNIVYSSGNLSLTNNYIYPVPVSDFVYFNTVGSNKYRFCFSTVMDSSDPIDFNAFSFNIKDSQGTTVYHASRSDFQYRIFNFGGVASGQSIHFFYLDFDMTGVSDDYYLGYSLRAQPKGNVTHSYDSFGLYGYTGTVADLIDWYEKNWEQTQDNVSDLNNNTDGTNDTIGGINDTEGGFFDSYNSYVDTAGISAFNFDVIGSELAVASGFIGSLYAVLPSVFKYFIIGIMTIGTFALILSVGGRISKRRG